MTLRPEQTDPTAYWMRIKSTAGAEGTGEAGVWGCWGTGVLGDLLPVLLDEGVGLQLKRVAPRHVRGPRSRGAARGMGRGRAHRAASAVWLQHSWQSLEWTPVPGKQKHLLSPHPSSSYKQL